jgi:hypothetical protein
MRVRLPLKDPPNDYNLINIDRYQLKELRNVAHTFDTLTGELSPQERKEYQFSAVDFIEWMAVDIAYRHPKE